MLTTRYNPSLPSVLVGLFAATVLAICLWPTVATYQAVVRVRALVRDAADRFRHHEGPFRGRLTRARFAA